MNPILFSFSMVKDLGNAQTHEYYTFMYRKDKNILINHVVYSNQKNMHRVLLFEENLLMSRQVAINFADDLKIRKFKLKDVSEIWPSDYRSHSRDGSEPVGILFSHPDYQNPNQNPNQTTREELILDE